MKFGSRIDLFLPVDATIAVKVGDRVIGGETSVATLASVVTQSASATVAGAVK